MEITVLLEPKKGHGYRATSGPPLATEAEGTSREEALGNLRVQIRKQATIRALSSDARSRQAGTSLGPVRRYTEG